MTDPCNKTCNILAVEDNPDDFELTRLAFSNNGCSAKLHCVDNGKECMDYLRRLGPYAGSIMPDLVLLDINMPVMDGFEVLTRIAADPNLRHLPVIVLTTSDAEEDVLRMYRLRCSAYVVKPADFNEFTRVVRALIDFWCFTACLPTSRLGG
jgi:CheY-like chemotaxis protein